MDTPTKTPSARPLARLRTVPAMARPGSPTPSTDSDASKRSVRRGHLCHVSVRVRPPGTTDIDKRCIWTVDEQSSKITLNEDFVIETSRRRIDSFQFDSVFYGSDNHDLYTTTVKRAVTSSMQGITATVFAYGQTASGKTYSMMGFEEQPGIIPQAVDDVFAYIVEHPGDREFLMRVSYMEIYNETIKDLLNPEQKDIRIHEHRQRGIYVSPLKEEIVTSPKQLMKVISRGEANRSVGATDYNDHSSRSHSIFTLTIESRARTPDASTSPSSSSSSAGGGTTAASTAHLASDKVAASMFGKRGDTGVTVSQLHLIDLAGSEKATDDLDRRKEGAFINKSLLTLGNVISRITEDDKGHIPYRDSKLTRILQSSLSGQSRISVIATLSPTSSNLEESLNTLKFAARVKRIVPHPGYNMILDDKALIQKYRREIEELKVKLNETNMLLIRERRMSGSLGVGVSGSSSSTSSVLAEAERQRYEEQLHESRLVRTALKERIDHLTKLILTSSTISAKPIMDWTMAASDANGKRASVMLTAGLLPPADPVARASMVFDARTSRMSMLPRTMRPPPQQLVPSQVPPTPTARAVMNRGVASDRAFIQKHIEEIDRRDRRIAVLEELVCGIKAVSSDADVRGLIVAFETTNQSVFDATFAPISSTASRGGSSSDVAAAAMAKREAEFEAATQAYQHQIEMLRKRLEDSQEIIQFMESDHCEVSKLVDEQQAFIETLKERCAALEGQVEGGRGNVVDDCRGGGGGLRQSTGTLSHVSSLHNQSNNSNMSSNTSHHLSHHSSTASLGTMFEHMRRETDGKTYEEMKASGMDARIDQVSAALARERLRDERDRAPAIQIEELEAELHAIQSRLKL